VRARNAVACRKFPNNLEIGTLAARVTSEAGMSLIDTSKLPVVERKPGWRGRYFNSANMTFAHYEFDAGSAIHEHSHPQEEVWHVLEGALDITMNGVTKRAGPGFVGIVPPDTPHSVVAASDGKAIVVDHPVREMG
jgi:quercetin dioxygenase-like cupin family protein